MVHTLLMGDPSHFSVVGGANPHTRDRYGRRKSVDRELAIRQWWSLHDLLRDHGLRIEVVPPHPELPDDTRLWAALQRVSGGPWGGCVFDVDEIVATLEAGIAARGLK